MVMWILLAFVALAAAKPLDEVVNSDWNNPEYGDLIEGDLEVPEGEELDREIDLMNALRDRRRQWPNGVLHYTVSSVYSSTQRNQIQAAVNDLMSSTRVNGRNCVTLQRRTNQAAYVSVERGSGCSSFVGRIGNRQRLSLADGCFSRGTIIHEFLHAYGFHHEQTRPDRDSWVSIDFGNIRQGTENNFRKYTTSQVDTLGTRYDYSSVMHYGAYAFAVDRNRPTIRALRSGGNNMGQRNGLSSLDIERIQVYYGCRNARDTEFFKHLANVPEFNMAEE